ncbi:MAG: hypothetical protein AABW73_03855 [Nanoarchaeota archaeon]
MKNYESNCGKVTKKPAVRDVQPGSMITPEQFYCAHATGNYLDEGSIRCNIDDSRCPIYDKLAEVIRSERRLPKWAGNLEEVA